MKKTIQATRRPVGWGSLVPILIYDSVGRPGAMSVKGAALLESLEGNRVEPQLNHLKGVARLWGNQQW